MYKASEVQQKYGYDPKRLDLSRIGSWNDFVDAMNYAMMKQYTALENGGRMAVLMGDIKKKGKAVQHDSRNYEARHTGKYHYQSAA